METNSQTKFYHSRFNKKVAQFNKHMPLREHIGELIGDKKEVRIAELACGLVNTIGDTWNDVDIDLVCSDVYADQYNAMWEEHNMKPLHPIEYQDMENLTYADDSFDIVHCENSLDHTVDPHKAVEEMKRVSRDYVYLKHAEGQKRIYGGHHHHNMEDVTFDGFTRTRDGKWIIDIWKV